MENDFIHFDRDNQTITVKFKAKPPLVVGLFNLEVSYFSGGPGGQNVNKNMSGVRLIFRIPEGYRMASRKGHDLIVTCMEQRQREQNLLGAFESLAGKLRSYFYVKPYRKPTKATYGSKQRRLGGKKIHSSIKRNRKISGLDL
jgi:ribosome-associated protein